MALSPVSIPNLITLVRIILVPVIFWLLLSKRLDLAFVVFVIAGISDAVDGYLAKRYHWESVIGAHLDPLADKLLIVSVFLALGFSGDIPVWLVIAVVSRDILIVIAVVLAWGLGHPLDVKPYRISKANTAAQITLAALVLADGAFRLGWALAREVLIWVTLALTLASLGAYLVAWIKHMAAHDEVPR